MTYPVVLVLESTHFLGHLLRSRCLQRTWVLCQGRSLDEVREELRPGRDLVLVVEIAERFLEALGWVREQLPGVAVIGILSTADARLESALLDLGLLACVPRSRVFDLLPDLVERALASAPAFREITA
jgi:hypothetical protein